MASIDDEKLIECVRNYPPLYDLKHPKYLDTRYKTYLWKKVCLDILQQEEEWQVCKNRWKNIRDQYRKSLKNRKTRSGQAAKSIKAYKYDDQLQFLNEYEEERPSISNVSENGQSQEPVSSENSTIPPNSPNSSTATPSQSQAPELQSSVSVSENSKPLSVKSTPGSENKNPAKRKRSKSPIKPISASATLIKYITEKNQNNASEKEHPMSAFLNGLAPTLKSLPPYLQHLAKGKIFQVVHDLELQYLLESSPSTNNNSPVNAQITDIPEVPNQQYSTYATLSPVAGTSSMPDYFNNFDPEQN